MAAMPTPQHFISIGPTAEQRLAAEPADRAASPHDAVLAWLCAAEHDLAAALAAARASVVRCERALARLVEAQQRMMAGGTPTRTHGQDGLLTCPTPNDHDARAGD